MLRSLARLNKGTGSRDVRGRIDTAFPFDALAW